MTEQVGRYDAEDITVLKGLEAVRRRPGMYVGGTDSRALHHLIYEVVDNSIDEALAGVCDRIDIVINPGQQRHRLGQRPRHPGRPPPRRKGLGAATGDDHLARRRQIRQRQLQSVRRLARRGRLGRQRAFPLDRSHAVQRDGGIYQQRYEQRRSYRPGHQIAKRAHQKDRHDDHLFVRRHHLFSDVSYRFETLAQRFREMAFVTKGVHIHFRDDRAEPYPRETNFYFEGGIKSFVRYLNRNRQAIHDPVHVEREIDDTVVEAALQFTDGVTTSEYAFANTIHTMDGGTHLTGLRTAITRTINDYARKANLLKDSDANLSGDDTREGLTAIVSVKHPDPQFESQTKVKLMNAEVKGQVESAVADALTQFLDSNSREAKKIVAKCLTSARARNARPAKRAIWSSARAPWRA